MTVDGETTKRTGMDTNREVFGDNMMTAGTQLRGTLGRFFDDSTTSLFRFEVKYTEEPEPGYISHRPVQTTIAIPCVHLLDKDGIVAPDKPVGGLEMKVSALIKYLLMSFGHEDSGLLSTVRTLNSTREPLLPHSKLSLSFLKEAGVTNLDVIRGGEERLTAYVNTHGLANRGKRLIRHIIAREDNKPLIAGISADNDRLDSTLDGAGKPDFESPYVTDGEVFALKLPATLFQREAVIAIPALESGKSCFAISILNPAKERLVGFVKAFNHFLETLGAYGLIFRESLFKVWQFFLLGKLRDRLVVVPVSGNTLLKGCVVEIPAEVKPSGSVMDSLRVRFNTIFEGLFHCSVPLFNISENYIDVNSLRKENEPHSSPALKCGAF